MTAATAISRVLVGVDFDEASASALRLAGMLASSWDADVTVFHSAMLDVPAYFTSTQLVAIEAERERSRTAVASRLHAFAEQHIGRAVRVVVGEGQPQHEMVRLAESFDLIVVGTHRRHGALRWWLGSVAETVVRHSPRPVLVVPAGAVVPATPSTILAVGRDIAAADAWADVLRTTFGATVVRSTDIQQCAPDRIQNADLIVLSMPPDDRRHAQFDAIVPVLKECVHPVLFVPSGDGIMERSSS